MCTIEYKVSKLKLVKAIKNLKERCWITLCARLENDTRGLPYRLAIGKLYYNAPIPEIETLERKFLIVEGLISKHPKRPQIMWRTDNQITEITNKELVKAIISLPDNKAPGTDKVLSKMLRKIIKHIPETTSKTW